MTIRPVDPPPDPPKPTAQQRMSSRAFAPWHHTQLTPRAWADAERTILEAL